MNLEVHSLSPRPRSLVPADRASQVLRDGAIRETVNTVLHLGLRYFSLEVATFSEAAKDTLIVHGRRTEEDEPPPSLIGPPGVAMRDVVVVHDAKASTSTYAKRLCELGDASYIGAPIVVDGRTVGVLEFTSRKPRAAFNEGDIEMIGSLSRWLESELVQAALTEGAKAPRPKSVPHPAFLASMSKELRTPISSLLGLSKAMKQENLGPLTEQQKQALDAVHESGRHLLSLVNDILELAKIESGDTVLAMGQCDVRTISENAMKTVRDQAQTKGVRIVFALDPRAETVRGDESRIQQMIATMLENAIRLSDTGSRIGFEVIADPEREAIRFDVSDTGTTLSDDDCRKIFSPFSEADSTLSQHCAGLGVGISLVHRLAAMHGGGLALERREGGNRFSVGIPHRVTEARPSTRTSWQNLLVMIVDPTDSVNTLLQPCLRARGHRVLVATSYDEARDLSAMFRPDVMVLEAEIPEGGGLQLLRAFRDSHSDNLAQVPTLTTCSLSLPGDEMRFKQAGATGYIARPVSMRMLVTEIEKAGPFADQG